MSVIVKKVDGKEYGFKFTNLTLIKYCQKRDIPLSDFDKDVNKNFLLSNSVMLQCAYEVYNKGEKTLNDYDVDDFLSVLSDEDHAEIFSCYAESMRGMITKFLPKGDSKKK